MSSRPATPKSGAKTSAAANLPRCPLPAARCVGYHLTSHGDPIRHRFPGELGLAGEFGALWRTKTTQKPESTPILTHLIATRAALASRSAPALLFRDPRRHLRRDQPTQAI